jgi:mono/diheme cytochrome c family protein
MVVMMRKTMLLYLVAAATLTAQFPLLAQPVDGDAASGRQIATNLCSSCHRVLPMTLSDKGDPPSFQSIAELPSTTGLSLKVFLRSNHKNLPNLILSEAETDDVIAYILSLKK